MCTEFKKGKIVSLQKQQPGNTTSSTLVVSLHERDQWIYTFKLFENNRAVVKMEQQPQCGLCHKTDPLQDWERPRM